MSVLGKDKFDDLQKHRNLDSYKWAGALRLWMIFKLILTLLYNLNSITLIWEISCLLLKIKYQTKFPYFLILNGSILILTFILTQRDKNIFYIYMNLIKGCYIALKKQRNSSKNIKFL